MTQAYQTQPLAFSNLVKRPDATRSQSPARPYPSTRSIGPADKDNLRVAVVNPDEIGTYARAVADLLGAQVYPFEPADKVLASPDRLFPAAKQADFDLVIFREPNQSLIKQLLLGSATKRVVDRYGTSMLVVRQPSWPLYKILLLIRNHETNWAGVNWAIRLARPSGAAVTVVPVMFPMLAPYNREIRIQQGLAMLLATDTVLGQQIRQVMQCLGDWGITGTVRLRQGAPEYQIRTELVEEDYDLIVVAAEPNNWWERRLLGEIVNPLLDWADRPVLIAKP